MPEVKLGNTFRGLGPQPNRMWTGMGREAGEVALIYSEFGVQEQLGGRIKYCAYKAIPKGCE